MLMAKRRVVAGARSGGGRGAQGGAAGRQVVVAVFRHREGAHGARRMGGAEIHGIPPCATEAIRTIRCPRTL